MPASSFAWIPAGRLIGKILGIPAFRRHSIGRDRRNAEVLYPAPHRLTEAGGTAIGYDNEVVFPVKITPEREGEPVELALTFDYGLCKDLCIPNTVELHAAIPADLGKGDAFLIGTALARVPKPAEANALPRIASVEAKLDGPKQGLIIEALFPEGASATDLFVNSPEVLVPVPKPVGPLAEGKQRFTVTFFSAEEAAAIKGKPLRFTLVSDQGSSETVWTAE
jgi:DsbC/DsbD-like thiol-disulfide interchange protein